MPVLKTYIAGQWVDIGGSTNPMTTAGDIIIGGVAGAPTRLAKGTDGQVLTVVSGVPAYAAASGGSATIDWTSPVVVTDTANLTYGKHYIVAVTAADKTLTLPEITATDYGKMIVVEIAAATTRLITIDCYAMQVIDGATARVMWAKEVAQLVATVNGWTKVGGKSIPFNGTLSANALTQPFGAGVTTKILCNTFVGHTHMSDVANSNIKIVRTSLYNVQAQIRYSAGNSAAGTNYIFPLATTTVMGGSTPVYRPASLSAGAFFAGSAVLEKDGLVSLAGYFVGGSFTPSTIYVSGPTDNATRIVLTEVPTW